MPISINGRSLGFMNSEDVILLEFPCRFPIKAMGLASSDFGAVVASIIRRHVTDLPESAMRIRSSTGGRYLAVTVVIEARSRDQLDAIYQDLSAHERVLIAL